MGEHSGEIRPVTERDDEHGCCALAEPHTGSCVYVCSMCDGRPRTCHPDDLGCECGFCDGYGYCAECSGYGFFNEFGEPCYASADELAAP